MRTACLIFTFVIIPILLNAQSEDGFGAAPVTLQKHQCLDENQRAEIKRLILENKTSRASSRIANRPSLAWPVRYGENYTEWTGIGISNFVDHNPEYTNQLTDHKCGSRSYDTDGGYNHQGTDIFSWPFSWQKMDNNFAEIVAAAPGTIIYKEGSNQDKSCSFNSSRWNAVYVEHSDGSVAWYGHLKTNSLTNKGVGQTVEKGEFLGIMGSSGNSTGPHLHLELYDSNGNLIDPYEGNCNPTTDESWWTFQDSYYQSGVNEVMTHRAAPVFGCYPSENPNTEVNFRRGDKVFFATYFRDQLDGTTSTHKVTAPDGSIWQEWTTLSPQYYSASYWYRSFDLPMDAQLGEWTFESKYSGDTEVRHFYVFDGVVQNEIEISPNVIQLNDVSVGNTASASFEISNTGQHAVFISSLSYPEGFTGSWVGQIDPGQSKTINLKFSPSIDQPYMGDLVIASNSITNSGSHTVALRGNAAATAILQTNSTLDFGEVEIGESATEQVQITNTGDLELNVSDITYPEGFTGTSSLNVDAGASNTLEITFSPVAEKSYNGALSLTSNAVQSPAIISLTAEGIIVLDIHQHNEMIYPNPNSIGVLRIPFGYKSISILDMGGRVHMNQNVSNLNELSIKKLLPGLYHLELRNENKRLTQKLLVR